jgi:hypothetical protein
MMGRSVGKFGYLLAAACLIAAKASGDDAPATRPALQQLDQEIRVLYASAQVGLLHVQLPTPQWTSDYALEPLSKYQALDPTLRQQILQSLERSSTQNQRASATTEPQSNAVIIVRPLLPQQQEMNQGPGGPLEMPIRANGDFTPTHIGILLDDSGFVLLPIFIERETCAQQTIRLATANGNVVTAKFVGSDKPTNLSVVKVDGNAGKPLPMGQCPPVGSVCLFISPLDGAARLGVWSCDPENWGLVLNLDGRLAGLARSGQMLCSADCRRIAGQIERFGTVRRPTLGVAVRQVALTGMPHNMPTTAMCVVGLFPGSAAEQAGLRPGDMILKIGDQPANNVTSLAVAMTGLDGQTNLQILRGDQLLTLNAILQLPPPEPVDQQK